MALKGVVVAKKLKPGFSMANWRSSRNHSDKHYFPLKYISEIYIWKKILDRKTILKVIDGLSNQKRAHATYRIFLFKCIFSFSFQGINIIWGVIWLQHHQKPVFWPYFRGLNQNVFLPWIYKLHIQNPHECVVEQSVQKT